MPETKAGPGGRELDCQVCLGTSDGAEARRVHVAHLNADLDRIEDARRERRMRMPRLP
jgi:hypothetical protein